MSSLQEFIKNLSKQTEQQITIPTGTPKEIEAGLNVLLKIIKTRHSYPRTFLVCNAVALNNGTDGARLTGFTVPNDKIYVLKNIDLVRTATGSFRLRCQWDSMGEPVDVVEDTSTNYHWYGYMVLGPGSIFTLTQGATVSGNGNVDGTFSGDVFDA